MLVPVIQQYVLPGTEIWTDQWGAYNTLNQLGYTHRTVNHSQNFVDPVSGVCTNAVEAYRSRLKRFCRQSNVMWSSLLGEHIDEFMWRDTYCRDAKPFRIILETYGYGILVNPNLVQHQKMDGAKNGLDQLEQDLEKLSLDSSSSSQVNCLVDELEKLVVDGSPPPKQNNKPPGQVTEEGKEVPCQQLQKQVLQQLLGVLKSPNTPERRQQILHILRNFPTIIAAFIKQRQVFQQVETAFFKQCQTYQKALTSQVPVQFGSGSSPASVGDLKLAFMRHQLRTTLWRHFDRRQQGPRNAKNDQQLLIAILKLQQKIRQVQAQRNNGSSPPVHAQKQAAAQFLRGLKSPRPATLRPLIWRKVMTLNRQDMLILYRPYHAASVAGNWNVRKQLLLQRQQLPRPLYVAKLRYQPLPKCSYQQAAEHFEPGPAAWNLGRSRGQASGSSLGTSYYASVCKLHKHDSLESEEPIIIQKLS